MTESVTIFFFANSNHLSNVKTLQSIYKQDYERINLLICNDCTYGFESERLLNNFEAQKPDNIQQIIFHENKYPMGEYRSQAQFWDRLDSEYYLTIHSGEYFTSPSALRECIEALEEDASLAAVATGSELWSNDFKVKLSDHVVLQIDSSFAVLSSTDYHENETEALRDCMVVYRLADLRGKKFQFDSQCTQISQYIVPQLIQEEKPVAILMTKLCRYSESSIEDQAAEIPAEFGFNKFQNIERLLQDAAQKQEVQESMLFQSSVPTPKKKQGRNIALFLYKQSTFARMRSCAVLMLLFIIAAVLTMQLDAVYMSVLSFALMACAIVSAALIIGMLCCNLYFKRNPQRLVNYNENE